MLRAALESCAVADRSALGRLIGTGPDLLDLLHRLSTADLKALSAGEGRPTVLTTPKGRIVERLLVSHLGDAGVLLVAGSGSARRVQDHLARYTFAEKTGLADATAGTFQLALLGPGAGTALEAAGLPRPGAWAPLAVEVGGVGAHLLGHDGLSGQGYSLVGPLDGRDAAHAALVSGARAVGGVAVDRNVDEAHRILRGDAAGGHELTEEHNPLEAGLLDAVSFDKGCYVGQEVVARLNTYDKVSRVLVGLELPAGAEPPRPGAALFIEGKSVGTVTSAVTPPGWNHPVALAYVKRKALTGGDDLRIDTEDAETTARVVDLPFPTAG
jgi:folate-binding protein YgfZ